MANNIDLESLKTIQISLKNVYIGKLTKNIYEHCDFSQDYRYLADNPYRFFIYNKDKSKVKFLDEMYKGETSCYSKETIETLIINCSYRNIKNFQGINTTLTENLFDISSCLKILPQHNQKFFEDDKILLQNYIANRQKLSIADLIDLQKLFIKLQLNRFYLNEERLFEF